MSEEVSEEFKKNMSEWVDLKKQITEAKKDLKVLTDREKELRNVVKDTMETKQIDTINLRKGKVKFKTSKRKQTFNKKTVESGLLKFFGGDEVKVESAMNCILDNLETVESSSVSLTGLNNGQ